LRQRQVSSSCNVRLLISARSMLYRPDDWSRPPLSRCIVHSGIAFVPYNWLSLWSPNDPRDRGCEFHPARRIARTKVSYYARLRGSRWIWVALSKRSRNCARLVKSCTLCDSCDSINN